MARNTDEDRGLEAELEGLRRSYESLREQRVRLEQDQAHWPSGGPKTPGS